VFFDDEYKEGEFTVTVYTRRDDAEAGRAWLEALLAASRCRANPFRHRVLESTIDRRFGLTFRVVRLPAGGREDVVLPASVWSEVDRNVHGFLAGLPRLKAAGLARNRGLLLEGVVTIATTNDVEAIDQAARRSARFDRVVHVPAPDARGRARILGRYLRLLDMLRTWTGWRRRRWA
jgi:SpoVK/Ycf46/Vps4 family AAA+-type ATPase